MDGLAVTRRLRAEGLPVPIPLLTARDALSERVAGLDAGADDYLVKPFEMDELTARALGSAPTRLYSAPARRARRRPGGGRCRHRRRHDIRPGSTGRASAQPDTPDRHNPLI